MLDCRNETVLKDVVKNIRINNIKYIKLSSNKVNFDPKQHVFVAISSSRIQYGRCEECAKR